MKRSEVLFGLLRIPLDALAVLAALLLSYRLREANVDLIPRVQLLEPARTLPDIQAYFHSFALPGVGIFIIVAALLHLYALRTTRSAWSEVGRILVAAMLWLVAVIAWYFLLRKQLFYSRILLLHATFFSAAFVLVGRLSVVLLQRAFLRSGVGVRLVVSLGTQPLPEMVHATLQSDVRYRYLGHVHDQEEMAALRQFDQLDLVLQTDPSPDSAQTIELINLCRAQHIGYAFLPPVFADVPHQLRVDHVGLTPVMQFQPTPLDGWGRVWKRLFDIGVSASLLVLLAPLFLVIILLVLLGSGWPVWYVSRRVGERGRCLVPVIKFRSMVRNADTLKSDLVRQNERQDGPLFKMKNDPRITRVGAWLRRWDLDELPQLINVLLGHMSLVGPRPHLPDEVNKYTQSQRRVFAVKPGITGLAQISGRSRLKFEDEVQLDLRYIEEWSLLLDLWILWRTVFVVCARQAD